MRIHILEHKTFDFDALLDFIPNRPEPIGDGEVEKHPLHSQRFRAIADYVIENHNADIGSYARETGPFDERQLGIVENWDYRKVEPLYITKTARGLKVRDGRHRCIIIAVMVLTGQIVYQPVSGEIHDFKNYVDIDDFCEFFRNWVLQFESEPAFRANLRIRFEVDELENNDLKKTMGKYGEMAEEILKAVSDEIGSRVMPLKIVGKCRAVDKHSARVDIV